MSLFPSQLVSMFTEHLGQPILFIINKVGNKPLYIRKHNHLFYFLAALNAIMFLLIQIDGRKVVKELYGLLFKILIALFHVWDTTQTSGRSQGPNTFNSSDATKGSN